MRKRGFIVTLSAIIFLLLCPLAVRADVIITPENDFFTRHYSECVFLGRTFTANGKGGNLSVKLEPGAQKEVASLANGETVVIQYTYDYNGQTWGATIMSYQGKPDGWIPMDQLLLNYDYISFAQEHQSEFYAYTGDLSELLNAGTIVFWTWPGSGEQVWTYTSDGSLTAVDNWLTPQHVYKDSAGRAWGFIPYFYGARNAWVCLSDPSNQAIPAFHPAPSPQPWPSGDPGTQNIQPGGLSAPLLIIILVAALAVGTLILIRIFWKPNKRGS